jgi:hypothetical protein
MEVLSVRLWMDLQILLEEDAAPKATDGLTAAAHLAGPCQAKDGVGSLARKAWEKVTLLIHPHHRRRREVPNRQQGWSSPRFLACRGL